MLVLAVTSSLRHEPPSIALERPDELAKLHVATVVPADPCVVMLRCLVSNSAQVSRSGLYAHVVTEASSETFEDEVLTSPVPVIVDFWARWCKPCEAIEPHLRALAEGWGERARLVRVDVDAEPGIASRYGVLSLPTVILFAGGEPKATVYGAQRRSRFEREFAPFVLPVER